jgi:hypothetical protein
MVSLYLTVHIAFVILGRLILRLHTSKVLRKKWMVPLETWKMSPEFQHLVMITITNRLMSCHGMAKALWSGVDGAVVVSLCFRDTWKRYRETPDFDTLIEATNCIFCRNQESVFFSRCMLLSASYQNSHARSRGQHSQDWNQIQSTTLQLRYGLWTKEGNMANHHIPETWRASTTK